jgi:protein TonB
MKRRPTLLSLTICVSLGLHAGLLLTLSLHVPHRPGTPRPRAPVKAISLINLALMEPPAPEQPPLREPPPPPVPEPSAAETAETFVSLEAPREDAAPDPDAAPPAPPDPAPGEPDRTALLQDYASANYEAIQRHIRSKLVYPPEARRAGIQGLAELSFIIHTDGQVSDVRIRTSSGSETLDTAAVEAIYAAAPLRPPPREARLIIPVAFRLR